MSSSLLALLSWLLNEGKLPSSLLLLALLLSWLLSPSEVRIMSSSLLALLSWLLNEGKLLSSLSLSLLLSSSLLLALLSSPLLPNLLPPSSSLLSQLFSRDEGMLSFSLPNLLPFSPLSSPEEGTLSSSLLLLLLSSPRLLLLPSRSLLSLDLLIFLYWSLCSLV